MKPEFNRRGKLITVQHASHIFHVAHGDAARYARQVITSQIMKPTTRDEFSATIKELLARRAGYRCSICNTPTVAPHSDANRAINLGEAAHIYSAAPGGPRANPALTSEVRSSVVNGIHLCKLHARLIDVDTEKFPPEALSKIKQEHELRIRTANLPPSAEYEADFLVSHETQVRHGRGSPSLSDLWSPRQVIQRVGPTPTKSDPIALLESEYGVVLISADQGTGRTSLLKRFASTYLHKRNCLWLDGRSVTESVLRDPLPFLAAGYRRLYPDEDGWVRFLDGEAASNLVLVDDLHLSPLNCASRRKFLTFLQSLSKLVVTIVSLPTLLEFMSGPPVDHLRLLQWELLDLSRQASLEMTDKWCRFRGESIPDADLDAQVARAQDQLEILFARKLMPRQPVFVLTALQMFDAGTPLDTLAGSFGGVYEIVIHSALAHNAKNQATITSERSYLEELAYWCEFEASGNNRQTFNSWFAERKAVHLSKVEELERSLTSKGFLAWQHPGFRFHYQKYYFLASFLRDNPNRGRVKEYIENLVACCWNEDYANTALFLAYLQPSSPLLAALAAEVNKLLASRACFDLSNWKLDAPFPKGFFEGINLGDAQPEANRRLLAERLDQEPSEDESSCETSAFKNQQEGEDKELLDLIKGFHLLKLLGQLIRNSPIALDAQQKEELVRSGMALSLRLTDLLATHCNPASLHRIAVGQVKDKVLKHTSRSDIEMELSGIACHLAHMIVFSVFRYTCFYLAHVDLDVIFKRILSSPQPPDPIASYQLIECGLRFELRSPDPDQLRTVYRSLPTSGQDLLRTWAWQFLWFNRVPANKRQSILSHLEMTKSRQLLLPQG